MTTRTQIKLRWICLTSRISVRLIRAKVRWWPRNIVHGDTHVHHVVFGTVLLLLSSVTSLVIPDDLHGARLAAAAGLGVGAALVLDEFALILHLQDVYWTQEGRLSVEMVSLTAGCLMFALVGVLPFGIEDAKPAELTVRGGLATVTVLHAVLVLVCAAKGKYRTALFGWFVPGIAWFGAFRLARPDSLWARHRYHGRKLAHAERRAQRFDARWDPIGDRLANIIGGAPSVPTETPGSQ